MTITKKTVEIALKRLDPEFTVGALVDSVLEVVKDADRRVFYHPKITTNRLIDLTTLKLEQEETILTDEDHINAIEYLIYQMIEQVVMMNGEIYEGEMKEIEYFIENTLDVELFHYDYIGDRIERAQRAITDSDHFTYLKGWLSDVWETVTEDDLLSFYASRLYFEQQYAKEVREAKSICSHRSLHDYLRMLGSVLNWDDSDV